MLSLRLRIWFATAAAVITVAAARSAAQTAFDPLLAVDVNIAAAEDALRTGELQIAESGYRSALMAGWMLMGALRVADHRLPDARDAYLRASTSAVDANAALQSLAIVHLQMGDVARAVAILTRVAGADSKDVQSRRLLAQALVANGQPEEAVQELEETAAGNPDDSETKFALASGYLRLKKFDAAQRLFDEVAQAKPLAETHVLIGRTYRDAGQYDRARAELAAALKMNPRVRRAHYYLGTVAVMAGGVTRLDEAIAEFQQELKLAPTDLATNLRLGMALVEARREAAALPALEAAVRVASAPPEAFYYLGRCQLALDRATSAVTSLRRALELTAASPAKDDARLRSIHYQLALALQKLGATEDAATHFAEAQRFSARRLTSERERLGRYLADAPESNEILPAAPILDVSPLSALSAAQRADLEHRITTALARAYVNLGVMQAQKQRFARAAGFFEQAVGLDANFPQAQYSLGVAYFNAQLYEKAVAPLARARDADPDNAIVRRMLAIAYLNTEAYAQAAALLAADPERESNPSLQYAYGLALVRSDRAAEAESIFSRLFAEHAGTPELSVVLGHAYAEQGNYDAAIEALRRALQLAPEVADANSALGRIYLKQGKLQEAEEALRAELRAHPHDVKARETLATVLDLNGRQDDALAELRTVLRSRPEFADARYLMGKILLSRGAADEAAAHLEAAARLAPNDANVHYQLARAYEKLGRADSAQKEFEAYQQLKEKRRGKTP
jgi:tetratricopeptide (TPR) repeat protein